MDNSLISNLRQANLIMRTTSMTVLMTFALMILSPSAMAVKAELGKSPVQKIDKDNDDTKLSKVLQKVEAKMAKLERKLTRNLTVLADVEDLKKLRKRLTKLDKKVIKNFDKIKLKLEKHNLPPVILERHQQTVDRYRAEIATLLNELKTLETTNDDAERLNQIKQITQHLKGKKNKRSQQPFDPNQLPNNLLKPNKTHRPKETKKAFIQAGLHNTPYISLAALGDFTYDKLAGANNPAYLAESDEVTLSPFIKDKAAELNHDPVKIHHWVRNNIEWLPTWGAIQNADLTLSAKRGNAMDIASLTVALLRASKIPARYVHGSIDVPADKFKNWAGGFDNITAAGDFASSGGIPITPIVSGGQITKIRLEHIWVEAAIDYHPSRGAKNKDADSWIQMDPSYKQYEYLQGLDVIQISGIDPEQLAQSFIDSGTVNESESWVTGFDATVLQNAQNEAQQKLEEHIQNNLIDPTVGDVIGGRKTIIQEFPILPSS